MLVVMEEARLAIREITAQTVRPSLSKHKTLRRCDTIRTCWVNLYQDRLSLAVVLPVVVLL